MYRSFDGLRLFFGLVFFSAFLLIASGFAYGQQFNKLLEENGLLESEPEPSKMLEIHGVVKLQKKYSVVIQSGQTEIPIKLPVTVPIQRELIRPELDIQNRSLKMVLPCTGEGGNQALNQVAKFELPETIYILLTFKDARKKSEFESGTSKRVGQYSLFKEIPNLELEANRDRKLLGILTQGEQGLVCNLNGNLLPIELGGQVSLLSGFSILNLTPGTEVSIQATETDNGWVAQQVRFQQVIPPAASTLPRLLCLGDMISFGYQRALHEQLKDQFMITHPPANCGGSGNWPILNRWLGDYSSDPWDVILFNVGMLDHQLEKEQYQENLRRWVEAIQPAGNKIVWLTTTPIQSPASNEKKLVGKVSGRMKLQNQWAKEVLADYPEIKTCDLWQVVVDGREDVFKDWWSKTRLQFNYRQSKPLAAAIAATVTDE